MYKSIKDEKNIKNRLNKSLYNNIILKNKKEEKKTGGTYIKKNQENYNEKSFFERMMLYIFSGDNNNYLTDSDKIVLLFLTGTLFVLIFFIIILFFIYNIVPPENIKIQEQIDKLKVNLEPVKLIQNSNLNIRNLSDDDEKQVLSSYFDFEAFLMPYKKTVLNYREIPTTPIEQAPAPAQPPVTSAFISLGSNSLNNSNSNVVVEKSVDVLKKINGINLDSMRTKVNNYFRILNIDKEPYVIFKIPKTELQSSILNTALRYSNK